MTASDGSCQELEFREGELVGSAWQSWHLGWQRWHLAVGSAWQDMLGSAGLTGFDRVEENEEENEVRERGEGGRDWQRRLVEENEVRGAELRIVCTLPNGSTMELPGMHVGHDVQWAKHTLASSQHAWIR